MAVSDLESLGLLDSSFPPGTLLIPRPLLETRDHIGFLKNHDLNPAASFWMGDIPRSLEGASRFGGRTILIMTSRAQDSLGDWFKLDFTPDLAAPDPQRAIEWISSLMI
jgi:hypothetical protein